MVQFQTKRIKVEAELQKNKSRVMTIRASACKSLGLNQIFLINYSSTLKEYTMMLILKKAHIEKKIITYRFFFWFFDQAFVFKTYIQLINMIKQKMNQFSLDGGRGIFFCMKWMYEALITDVQAFLLQYLKLNHAT